MAFSLWGALSREVSSSPYPVAPVEPTPPAPPALAPDANQAAKDAAKADNDVAFAVFKQKFQTTRSPSTLTVMH